MLKTALFLLMRVIVSINYLIKENKKPSQTIFAKAFY